MRKNWFILITVALIVIWATWVVFLIENSHKTPSAPGATVNLLNPFTQVYEEIGDLPLRTGEVVFLQHDDSGGRLAVVENYKDVPHISLYKEIPPLDEVDARAALEKGEKIEAVLGGMRCFKTVEFIDWDRDGFVHGNFKDEFRFGEKSIGSRDKSIKLSYVSAADLDSTQIDKLNVKYLAILREVLRIYQEKRAAGDVHERTKRIGWSSAAREAIDGL